MSEHRFSAQVSPLHYEAVQRAEAAEAKLNNLRVLCGGEDPVDCLTRIAEAVKWDPALSGPDSRIPETLSGWVASGHEARDAQIARAEHDVEMWREAWKSRGRDLNAMYEALEACLPNRTEGDAVADIKALGEARGSLLDLVQRLLDHSPDGRHPYFLIGTEKLPEVLLPDERWAPLREEARAKVAELRKGEG